MTIIQIETIIPNTSSTHGVSLPPISQAVETVRENASRVSGRDFPYDQVFVRPNETGRDWSVVATVRIPDEGESA